MNEFAISMETNVADPTFQRVLNCLEQIRLKLNSRGDDFLFLSNYFQSKDFRKLFKVHSTISCPEHGRTPRDAKEGTAEELAQEVVESLPLDSPTSKELQELTHILKKPHVKGLLQAHDLIARGQFTSNSQEDEGSEIPLINVCKRPQTVDDRHAIPMENFETEENKNRVNSSDYNEDVGADLEDDDDEDDVDDDDDNDDDDDEDDDDVGKDDGVDDEDIQNVDDYDEGIREQSEVAYNDDFDETIDISDSNKLDTDSSSTEANLDNKDTIETMVRVQVTDSDDLRNFNTDPPRWDESTPNWETVEKSVTFSAHVLNINDVIESHGAAEEIESVKPNDTKEEKRTEIKVEKLVNGVQQERNVVQLNETQVEKIIKGGHKNNGVTRQKIGLPVLSMPGNAVKTIRLFRNAKETLGITVKAVRNTENIERIMIARILSGGLADTFGTLDVNDEILEINGRRVEGMTANEVAELMDGITGSVDIKIVPQRTDRKLTRETKVSLRAFFDYNPLQDPLIPCKEVGVAFSTGDILHVVNMEDAKWWQARKEGCSHDKAGLIPSKDFQEKRQRFETISSSSDVNNLQKDKNGRRAFSFWRKGKNDSNTVLCNFLPEVQMASWPAYEPVGKYLETSEKRRLLLLIGASGAGRNELKRMLLSSNPDKFVSTVPHTSRHMKTYETDGREYFFVSRQTMETFIQKKKFIEFGEYRGCLYGTSKDSIKRALKTGKTCVLKVQPEVMLLLRTAEFKPYCVYIKPPPLKELRTSRLTVQGKAERPSNASNMRTFKEEDLQEMLRASRELEENYGKFFDLTVVNKDLEAAYNNIFEAVERLERLEQWVPRNWIQ